MRFRILKRFVGVCFPPPQHLKTIQEGDCSSMVSVRLCFSKIFCLNCFVIDQGASFLNWTFSYYSCQAFISDYTVWVFSLLTAGQFYISTCIHFIWTVVNICLTGNHTSLDLYLSRRELIKFIEKEAEETKYTFLKYAHEQVMRVNQTSYLSTYSYPFF